MATFLIHELQSSVCFSGSELLSSFFHELSKLEINSESISNVNRVVVKQFSVYKPCNDWAAAGGGGRRAGGEI